MDKKVDRQCPGDDPTRKAVPEVYICPGCGGDIEIWTDESRGKCRPCTRDFKKEELAKKT